MNDHQGLFCTYINDKIKNCYGNIVINDNFLRISILMSLLH